MNKYTFPENLKRIRSERGLTQKQFAAIVGLHENTIIAYENSRVYPTIDRIYDMSSKLNVSIDDLLGQNHNI